MGREGFTNLEHITGNITHGNFKELIPKYKTRFGHFFAIAEFNTPEGHSTRDTRRYGNI